MLDLAIIGAGFSGRALSHLIEDRNPDFKVKIFDRSKNHEPRIEMLKADPLIEGGLLHTKVLEGSEWVRSAEYRLNLLEAAASFQKMESKGALIPEKVEWDHNLTDFAKTPEGHFRLWFRDGDPVNARFLAFATGGERNHAFTLLRQKEFPILDPIPLFLGLKPRGTHWVLSPSIDITCTLSSTQPEISASGILQVSPRGFEGPAISVLTAQAAQEWKDKGHQVQLQVDWTPDESIRDVRAKIHAYARNKPKDTLGESLPLEVPSVLWKAILQNSRLEGKLLWREVKPKKLDRLVTSTKQSTVKFSGYRLNKEERAWGGGVALNGLHAATLESRQISNLFCIGEMLAISPMPGGFSPWVSLLTATNACDAILAG